MAKGKVLLTGASGRLGKRLVPLLTGEGYTVRALVHRAPPPENVEAVDAGITDITALTAAMEGVRAVCHLAALMPPTSDDEIFEANVRGTYCLLQAARAQPRMPRFVFASSDATYCTGWSKGPYAAPIDEAMHQQPALFYGISKTAGERLCIDYQAAFGIDTVRLRFPTIVEPREALDLFLVAGYKDFLVDEDLGKWDRDDTVKIVLEESGRPMVEHVVDSRDAALGAFLAIDRESAAGQAFNIAGPAPWTYSQIGPGVAERLGMETAAGRCRRLYSYELNTQRARAMLGYTPRYGILDSLEEAYSQVKV